jgi:indolepyruvate ferredoxin oxidoreductase beta subunit
VENNLQTFAASYELARQQRGGVQTVQPALEPAPAPFALPAATTAEGGLLLGRIATFPEPAREMIYLGVKKLVDYQHSAYARLYLDRLESLRRFEAGAGAALVLETARFLALWMAFEDLPRVAQIKISPERFQRFRDEVRAEQGQQLGMVEFLHPRVEEFCGIMPANMGRFVLGSPLLRRLLGLFAKPRNLRTNSLHGFLLLYFMAKLRRVRPYSLVYQLEHAQMEQWLEAICAAAARDQDLALELARCGRLVKGYGDTRERGTGNLQRILAVYRQLQSLPGHAVSALRDAAMADEGGAALAAVEAELLARR